MYNPNDASDQDSGGSETASGERYDAEGWTAAIRTDLRAKFGSVGYGRNYRPVFVLVQSDDRQAIVRINDVGKLKRGRIIDLNQRAMRYFDPTLQLGVVERVSVTPLAGQDWALGPLNDDPPVSLASADRPPR
jgi:rare lipoprotein A